MNFPFKLKKLREEKKITQEELARQIYVSRSLIARYENGSVFPIKDNLEKIALYFNVRVDELIDKEDNVELSLESIKVANDVYKKVDNLEQKINIIFMIAILTLSLIFVLFSFLPILRGSRFVYPIPSGQTVPNREYYYTSLVMCTIRNNNPIVLITNFICIINASLAVLLLVTKNKKLLPVLKMITYIIFVVSCF